MAQAIPLAILAITAASSAYQVNASMDQASAAKDAAKAQTEAQNKLLNDQQANNDKMQKDQAAQQASAQASDNLSQVSAIKKSLPAGAGGRSDTILTSPLGLSSGAPTVAKTLLGA